MASSSLSLKRKRPGASKTEYDAFINHRGPDVKDTLAFALYDSLEEKGFWAFLDDMELQLGDSIPSAIEDAIYSSTVQIAIFSPGYAESSWCLDELLLMLETKSRFIPIFCDLKPSDLRFPDKGVYAAAFAKHKEKGRFNDRLPHWKAGLHKSSLISGYEFCTSNDDVEILCTRIALAVQKEFGKEDEKDVEAGSASRSIEVKKASLLPRDSRPVGLESKVEEMVGWLENPEVQVIAVVGMGGSGKTFLLQNVYKAVKSKYVHSIWLSISQSYSLKNLQHDVASHIGLNSAEFGSEERTAELFNERLQGQSSLIVLDDLWTLSTQNSLFDKLGLPADKDCKVVVTTRNRQVALNSCADRIYEMQNLSDKDSWRLFCIYAFPQGSRARVYMEEEGRKIVKQCGNLPLAIKTVAASLANCTDLIKWELKRRELERVVTPIGDPDPDSIIQILKLSYDSLPPHLKPCFAYLSFFYEDEEISADYLINLWMGEGFIPAGEDQWERGWDWLDQLAQLCLLQIFDYTISRKYCKIHDLLYDLAIQVSKEDKCVFSVEGVSPHTSSGARGGCRILLAKKGLHDSAISEINPVYLRTLSLSQKEEITSIPENLFTTMRGLRILDLSYTGISTLPVSLGKMILLKVLNLKGTMIRVVPDCVRHMKSLFFLALPHDCDHLPVWISELRCLQHLECKGIGCMPKGISKLTSLRTLRSYFLSFSIKEDELEEDALDEDKFMSMDDLVDMAQLQELSFTLDFVMQLKRLEEGILAHLVKMRNLEINNEMCITEERELPQFPEKMKAMKHLEILTLHNFVMPSCICEFANMRELHLIEFEFSDCPELQILPNLVVLRLEGNEKCKELPKSFGKSGGFPQLDILMIRRFSSLMGFPELEDGAMPCLYHFSLLHCPNVKRVEGLERLKKLESLNFHGSEGINKWWETLKGGGEYWNEIRVTSY